MSVSSFILRGHILVQRERRGGTRAGSAATERVDLHSSARETSSPSRRGGKERYSEKGRGGKILVTFLAGLVTKKGEAKRRTSHARIIPFLQRREGNISREGGKV